MLNIYTSKDPVTVYNLFYVDVKSDVIRPYRSNEDMISYVLSRDFFWTPEAYMTLPQQQFFTIELVKSMHNRDDVTVVSFSDIFAQQINNYILSFYLQKEIGLDPNKVKLFNVYRPSLVDHIKVSENGFIWNDINEFLINFTRDTHSLQDEYHDKLGSN